MRKRTVKYILALAVILGAASCAAPGQKVERERRGRAPEPIPGVNLAIVPAEPTQSDDIWVTFSVFTMANATGAVTTHYISENVIVVQVTLARPEVEHGIRPAGGFGCSEQLGTLRPGRYTLVVEAPTGVRVSGNTSKLEFTVSK